MTDLATTEAIFNEVCGFLKQFGGVYDSLTVAAQENVFLCITVGQYTYEQGKHFACWFRTDAQGLELLAANVRPDNIFHGPLLYVAEAACNGGLADMMRGIRKANAGANGVCWHRPSKDNKMCFYPSWRGAEVSNVNE